MPKQPQVVVYKPYAPTTHSAKRARTDVAHERDAFMVRTVQCVRPPLDRLICARHRSRLRLDRLICGTPSPRSPAQSGDARAVMFASTATAPFVPRAPRAAPDDRKRVRVDFDTIFQDVTALGATAFTGKDKKQWEAKRLAALGAVVKPRKEKMPLKMAIGVAKVEVDRGRRAPGDGAPRRACCRRFATSSVPRIAGTEAKGDRRGGDGEGVGRHHG